ncbi:hypothetical protein G6011_00910 [Alternaria panax]|uniref:Uncharacterized protein n=1 Tax=Alternaria panax TaxID=48097 RepID=A0AAD4NVH0_9PLEO|nr:hypothetical protein G6011_00910 [Alternaria panax]
MSDLDRGAWCPIWVEKLSITCFHKIHGQDCPNYQVSVWSHLVMKIPASSQNFVTTYVDYWSGHRKFEFYDADFGNDNDLEHSEIDTLAEHCPDLEAYGSRDNILNAPLQDGKWGCKFEIEAPFIAETLATGFRALRMWKIYYTPVPLGVPNFGGWDADDDVHRLLAHRLYGYFREACEDYGIECKLECIILVAQDVVIPDRVFVRDGLPGD